MAKGLRIQFRCQCSWLPKAQQAAQCLTAFGLAAACEKTSGQQRRQVFCWPFRDFSVAPQKAFRDLRGCRHTTKLLKCLAVGLINRAVDIVKRPGWPGGRHPCSCKTDCQQKTRLAGQFFFQHWPLWIPGAAAALSRMAPRCAVYRRSGSATCSGAFRPRTPQITGSVICTFGPPLRSSATRAFLFGIAQPFQRTTIAAQSPLISTERFPTVSQGAFARRTITWQPPRPSASSARQKAPRKAVNPGKTPGKVSARQPLLQCLGQYGGPSGQGQMELPVFPLRKTAFCRHLCHPGETVHSR